jgi:hypothetical protein
VLKAIKEGDEEALKVMIKDGKNLAEPNKEGWLPLHEAAYYGQLGCLKVLQRGEGLLSGPAVRKEALPSKEGSQGYRPHGQLKSQSRGRSVWFPPTAALSPGLLGWTPHS